MYSNLAKSNIALRYVPTGPICSFRQLHPDLRQIPALSKNEKCALRVMAHCASLVSGIEVGAVVASHLVSTDVEKAVEIYAQSLTWPRQFLSGARTATQKLGIQGMYRPERLSCLSHPLIDRWLEHSITSPEVRSKIRFSCGYFLRWLRERVDFRRYTAETMPLSLIKRDHLLVYRQYLWNLVKRGKLAGTTAKHYLQHVVRIIRGIQSDFHILNGIEVDRITLRDSQSRLRILPTDEQINALLKHLGSNERQFAFKVFLLIMISTGARPIELLSATFENLNPSDKIIWLQSKNGPGRWMPLGDHVWILLQKYLSSREILSGNKSPLFITGTGARMNYNHWQSILRKIREQHGVSIDGLVALRHRFATDCLESGADDYTVCYMLGHSSTDQLHVYQHVRWRGIKRAVASAYCDGGPGE